MVENSMTKIYIMKQASTLITHSSIKPPIIHLSRWIIAIDIWIMKSNNIHNSLVLLNIPTTKCNYSKLTIAQRYHGHFICHRNDAYSLKKNIWRILLTMWSISLHLQVAFIKKMFMIRFRLLTFENFMVIYKRLAYDVQVCWYLWKNIMLVK